MVEDYIHHSPTFILDGIADTLASKLPDPKESLRLIVTVPARNEEGSIATCLKALADQQASLRIGVDYSQYEVIVICHACMDRTAKRCKEIQRNYPFMNLQFLEVDNPEVNNVGAIRRVAMSIASKRLSDKNGYIVSTDADSTAHRFFISNLLRYVGSGYSMLCGRIDIKTKGLNENARTTLMHRQNYFQLRTRLENSISPDKMDPLPRHAHNSGPNMAVRKDVYDLIGGIPPKVYLEDIALYDAVCKFEGYIRHCPDIIVVTSDRTVARAPKGFGNDLKTWSDAEKISLKVEGLERLRAKFRLFEAIRNYYDRPTE